VQIKWYIRSFLFILAIAGISFVEPTVANQEIVIQFSEDSVTLEEAQSAIATIKMKLQDLGASQIQVQETTNGGLKISYYSTVDVVSIKSVFSTETLFQFGQTANNTNNRDTESLPIAYQLDITEIQQNGDFESDLAGTLVEQTTKVVRFFNPDVYLSVATLIISERKEVNSVAYNWYRKNGFSLQNADYSIPEVRAGPSAGLIS
jgi:hypothetical protein